GIFADGWEPPTYFVGREVWLLQTVQQGSLFVNMMATGTTIYNVAISLCTEAWASPVNEGFAHIAVADLRGLPTPDYRGGPGVLRSITSSNGLKVRLVELRVQTCGRNSGGT